LKLLRNELEISSVALTSLTAVVKRTLPDTIYNFQFIIDAFAPAEPQPETTDTGSMKISVSDVALDRIRLVYKDDVSGNDMTVWLEHFDTEISEFDLATMRFHIPEINLLGLTAAVYQHKPLVTEEPAKDDTSSAPLPALSFGEINLEDIKMDYGNDVSA